MITFFLWCILLVVCWPLALLALILYPLIWLLLLPFRIVGIAVGGVLELVKAIIFLPARVLRGKSLILRGNCDRQAHSAYLASRYNKSNQHRMNPYSG